MCDKEYSNEEDTVDSPIRDHLVNTAVNFLLNPDVRKRRDDSKISFLKKKGLTDAEISVAFDRAKHDPNCANNNTLVFSDQMKRTYHPVSSDHEPPHLFWSRLSGISSSLIVFGVAAYGLHHLYKKFIRPWLHGGDTDSELNHIKEVTKNLALLTETIEKLHNTVMKQNEEINKLMQLEGCGYAPTPVILEDLKREVNSLKSILISRHQFPAIPQIQTAKATIPSWQLPSSQTQSTESGDAMHSQKLETDGEDVTYSEESLKTPDTLGLLPHLGVEQPFANGSVEDMKADEA